MKLTDTQLMVLTEAAQRVDRLVQISKRKSFELDKVVPPLLKRMLVEEIPSTRTGFAWRRDDQKGVAFALRITDAGLKMISADEGDAPPPETSSEKKAKEIPRAKKITVVDPHGKTTAQQSRENKKGKQPQILRMLHSKSGTTIMAIVKITGWQPHSVRGFLSGIVKKKLELNLQSELTDKGRVYRIVEGPTTKASKKTAA